MHEHCDGNTDCLIHGVTYQRLRCSCTCHPRQIKKVHWPSSFD
jgi:hypothetical protein